MTTLWKDEHLPRLDLAPLDAAATTGLVARVLGGPVEFASAHRLWTLTEGSPLFLRHLLAGEVSAGRFRPTSGIWRWTSGPMISPELAGLLEHQIGCLAARVQDVVDLVALTEPVAVPTLSALTSPSDVRRPRVGAWCAPTGWSRDWPTRCTGRSAAPQWGSCGRAAYAAWWR